MATVKKDEVEENITEEEVIQLTPEERLLESQNIIKNHMMVSLGFGIIPIPVVDLIGITGTQLNMLRSLSKVYGQEFKQDLGKKAIGSLVGGGVSIPIAMGLSSLVKLIPVVGQSAGVISMATSGAALTYAVGKVFVQHFESGGTFLTFDPAQVKEYFKSELEKGKNMAKGIAKDMKKETKVSA
ncbi:MAG: DUF697 domain-containing protein [Sulfurovum sp.]